MMLLPLLPLFAIGFGFGLYQNPVYVDVASLDYLQAECVELDSSAMIRQTESGIPFVRTPDSRFDELLDFSYEPHYVELPNGLRYHYIDEKPGSEDRDDLPVVLLLHGQPSWSYLYRKMIPVLSEHFRVIALDQIGMGRSDKPIDPSIHNYEQHVAWIKDFIELLELKDIHLFVQDWGSLMGLRVAGDNPDLFATITIANGNLPVIPEDNNPFEQVGFQIDCTANDALDLSISVDPSPLEYLRDFQEWIHFSSTFPNWNTSTILQRATVGNLTKAEMDAYDAPYPSLIYKAAPRSFPSMITGVTAENNLQAWQNLGQYTKPFLVLGAAFDRNMGQWPNMNKWIDHVPGAANQDHHQYSNSSHFIQDDVGYIMAQKVASFIKSSLD